MSDSNSTIVVIGAGIIGLTTALTFQAHYGRRRPIVIIARDFPVPSSSYASINYASMWAGAHYRPEPDITPQGIQEATFCRRTYEILKTQAATEPEAGITFLDGIEYFEAPTEAYTQVKGRYGETDGFRVLRREELPDGVEFGCSYRAWTINTPVYCAHLLRKFIIGGGETKEYTLLAVEEAFKLEDDVGTVVNCSGFGFGDPKVFITRGQTCLVRNHCAATITQQNADGTWSFLIPRGCGGGTVVGGTKQPHDWTPTPVPETRQQLLAKAAKMHPQILNADGEFDVIRDIVGRRPTRQGGMRLETESTKQGAVVHAYGAGGRGYEMSWGVAEEVLGLVSSHAPEQKKAMARL